MNEAQVKQIRNIQAEIDAERAEMDGGKKDLHPTDYDMKIIPNPHSPLAQQNLGNNSNKLWNEIVELACPFVDTCEKSGYKNEGKRCICKGKFEYYGGMAKE